MKYLVDFYTSLNTTDLVLFWTIVFIVLLLLFLTIALSAKSRELSKLLTEEVEAKKKLLSEVEGNRRIKLALEEELTQAKNQIVSLSNIKKQEEIKKEEEKIEPVKEEEIIDNEFVNDVQSIENLSEEVKPVSEIEREINEQVPEKGGLYQKNVFRASISQTSPIHIMKKPEDVVNIADLTNEKDELKEEKNQVEEFEDEYYDSLNDGNTSFVEEVSKRIEVVDTPEPIELTDYEKKQEDEAIISYQELLAASENPDKQYQITDDENIDDFINNLKEFRTNLE